MDERRAGRDQDWTDSEAEGIPLLDEQPPGVEADTAVEGGYPPRDHPVAVEERGVTAAEAAVPETLEERVARERPDVLQRLPEEPEGRIAEADDPLAGEDLYGEWDTEDAAGLSPEEAAVHLEEG
jgi:hypothetical protein